MTPEFEVDTLSWVITEFKQETVGFKICDLARTIYRQNKKPISLISGQILPYQADYSINQLYRLTIYCNNLVLVLPSHRTVFPISNRQEALGTRLRL